MTVRGPAAADRQWFDLVPERGGSLRLADRLCANCGRTCRSARRATAL
ncbi:hypothetical protein OHT76_19870 [Streptomyces sp. NBC_00287]|nr:hypothetical protein [Streptomyces sp. NBC_00287]